MPQSSRVSRAPAGCRWSRSNTPSRRGRTKFKREGTAMVTKLKKMSRWPALTASLITGLALFAQSGALSSAQAAQGAPQIVSTTPARGAADVNPSLKEITVTFDQDMEEGMSWTGGGTEFPPIPEGQQGRWRDKRSEERRGGK